ncbi:MAG: hypothetical protein IKP33_05690 [Prevotella sp.]|nr:hypothetical protein [Prevotella sp.]
MKARRFLNLMMASLVAMAYTSCSNSDDVIDTPDPIVKTYTMTVDAQKGSNGTRALSLDGSTLNSTWTKDDAVEVYKGEDHIGTLTAQSTGANTSLKGTLSGDLYVNDNLTLKYLSADYNSQDGTLTGTAKSIDKVCDYSTATVTVSGIAGGNISTTNANFANQQAVIKFTLKNADGASLGNPTAFSVTDGTSMVTLSDIPAETYTTNGGTGVLYVAFPASGASATISLEATVGSDTYAFEKTGITFTNSKYYGVTVKMKKIPVLNGKFTVNASGDQIRFSPGNLQYTKSTSTWSFMDHQYSTVETAGQDVGTDYAEEDAVVSLFGWGTSNQTIANYGSAKQPWSTNTTSTNYGPSGTYNLTDTYANGDWGVNMGSGWRTLSNAEWDYLFKTRTNAAAKYGYATVNSVYGIIILPDVFTDPNKNNGSNAFAGSTTTGWDANVYTSENWAFMEANGAVFLPAAGNRNGSSVYLVGSRGYYWSSSANGTDSAYRVYFYSGNLISASTYDARRNGYSVRLVRDVVAP